MVFRHRRRRMYHPPYSGVYTNSVVLRRCGEERGRMAIKTLSSFGPPPCHEKEGEGTATETEAQVLDDRGVALLPLLLLLACDLQFPPSFPFFCPLERVATIAAHYTAQCSRKFKGDKSAIERKNHCELLVQKVCFSYRFRCRFF